MKKLLSNKEKFNKKQHSFFNLEGTRQANYELLRGLVIFGLVLGHQYRHHDWKFGNGDGTSPNYYGPTSIYSFGVLSLGDFAPVGFFAFFSGFFLVKNTKNVFLKAFIQLLIFWLINVLATVTLHYTMGFVAFGNDKDGLKNTLLFGGRDGWYFRCIMFIYLLSPLISYGFQYTNKGAMLCTCVAFYTIMCYFGDGYTSAGFSPISFLTLFSFYLCGCGGGRGGITLFCKKITITYSVLLLLLLEGLQLYFWLATGNLQVLFNPRNVYYGEVFFIIAIVNLFGFIQIKRKSTVRFCSLVGSVAPFIYLFHAMIEVAITNNYIFPPSFYTYYSGLPMPYPLELHYGLVATTTFLMATAAGIVLIFPIKGITNKSTAGIKGILMKLDYGLGKVFEN